MALTPQELEEMTPDDHRLVRLYSALRKMETAVDDLTAVVVAGTYFEYYVRRLIATKADLAQLEPETQPLEMSVLIRMARSLDVLPDEVARPLVGIARLRNVFAHDIDYTLTDADIDKLVKRLTPEQRLDWQAFHRIIAEDGVVKNIIAHKLRCYILCVRVWLEELYDPFIPLEDEL